MFGRHGPRHEPSGGAQRPADPPVVDVNAAQALLEQGAQLIDVREPSEFKDGHARGAKNIPLGDLLLRKSELDPARTLLLICQSGGRSASGQKRLLQEAFSDVRNVTGGTSAWKHAGLPIEK